MYYVYRSRAYIRIRRVSTWQYQTSENLINGMCRI